jgi:Methyltransferase FkbM domain
MKTGLGMQGRKRVKILAGPARGVTMMLDFSGQTPMYLGMFEWELHGFFRAALAEASLVFDVGGYIGYDALMFAANCRGEIVTFEPDERRAQTIRQNVACNPELEQRVRVATVAVGRRDGNGVTSLDTFSKSVGQPDFIKIDIDGGELDALAGAISVLNEHRPHVVVETHSLELERECGQLLIECGYQPAVKHNRRVWREHRGGVPHNRWLLAAGLPSSRSVGSEGIARA